MILFSLLVCGVLVIFFAFYSIKKWKSMSEKLKELQLYNESLQTSHDDLQAFRHDFGNIMQSLGAYIASEDLKGLRVYYSELFSDFQKSNNFAYLSPEVINNPAVYGILASKYQKANELGVTVLFDVFLDFNCLNMKIYEFSRILGILIDNAIEAASECEEKKVHIEIRRDARRNRQILVIENTYLEEKVDLEHMFQKGFSSKEHNSGIGLWEVNKILKKYPNVNLRTSHDGHFFTQQLEMYKVGASVEGTVVSRL